MTSRSDVFIVNFEQVSQIALVFPLLTLKVNAGWILKSLMLTLTKMYPLG